MAIDNDMIIALVASRVCHDLASPLQALTTALDVLEGDNGPEMHKSAVDLIRESTMQASAKVDFMRSTFGSLTAGAGDANLTDLRNIATKYIATLKPILDWQSAREMVSRPLARIVMNFIMIAIDSLPRGGEIIVTDTQHGDLLEFNIKAQGPRVMLKPAMRLGLQGLSPEEGYDGRSIQPYLAYLAASKHKIELAAREDEQSITLIARMQDKAIY
jgi:histidine phosphotransferase ChpT